MSVDMSRAAVSERLGCASRLAVLDPRRRLEAKLDMSRAEASRRLRLVSDLRALCLRLGRLGQRGPSV